MRARTTCPSHRRLPALAAALVLVASGASAATEEPARKVEFKKGPYKAPLGGIAQVEVPAGYVFVERNDVPRFLELNGNPASGDELGVLLPSDAGWAVYFEFSEIGFVKDDEKDKLDADKILASIRQGNDRANEYRRERGWSEIEVVGWDQAPFYDETTNNLTWAVRGRSARSESVNYNSRILGRAGVMEANLVVSPDELRATVPVYKELLKGFAYGSGQAYAEYRPGDKLAKYGLAALVAGGAAVAAAKTGLLAALLAKFAKLGKLLLVLVAGVGAAIWRGVRVLLARRKADPVARGPFEG